MKRSSGLWARWQRLAHRAAEIQAAVLLTVLYALVVVPVGLLRRRAARAVLRETGQPAWQARSADPAADRLQDARQQF